MKGVLFIGSGNSIASGLPSVQNISDYIYKGRYNYYKSDDSEFIKSEENYKEDPVIKKMRNVMRVIQEIDDELSLKSAPFKIRDQIKFSGSLYKGDSNYEDLYFIVNEIYKSSQGLSTNSTINSMILHIEERSRDILHGDTVDERIIDLGKVCFKCTNFIDWLIPQILIHDKVIGLDLIVEIANKFSSLDIITLNHDLLIEDIFRQHGIEYDDGFHGEVEKNSQKFLGFQPDSKVKLIKPHGSINWISSGTAHRRLSSINIEKSISHRIIRVLTGTNKILAYNRGVFSEMFYQFHTSLRTNNLMIISGYGMGDEGINMRINYWLENPSNRVLILHNDPDKFVMQSYTLSSIRDKYMKQGRLIFIGEWLSNLDYDTFEQIIVNFN